MCHTHTHINIVKKNIYIFLVIPTYFLIFFQPPCVPVTLAIKVTAKIFFEKLAACKVEFVTCILLLYINSKGKS